MDFEELAVMLFRVISWLVFATIIPLVLLYIWDFVSPWLKKSREKRNKITAQSIKEASERG